jgi:hypothetical protein
MQNDTLLHEMRQNCLAAREKFNWQEEEKKLISFYHTLFDRE